MSSVFLYTNLQYSTNSVAQGAQALIMQVNMLRGHSMSIEFIHTKLIKFRTPKRKEEPVCILYELCEVCTVDLESSNVVAII